MTQNDLNVQEHTHADHFLHQLRSRTADSHKRLEELPVSTSITSPNITKASYAHYLQLMGAVIHQTESAIFPKLAHAVPDIDNRHKSKSIIADLKFMGYDLKSFPPPFTKNIDSEAFALGIMYVVEGSTLGGRFILKNIQQALGFEQEGTQYFSGYGNKTGSSWKHFLDALTSYEAKNGHMEEIIKGADYAFTAIYDHLKSHSGHED
ncbi:biliverdin-producing heme oxygenase [Flavobacterium pallidum]|uniref:Heme oxygenase n=1 Tax=Flavobacterium pallidum TaxID=2172098 RepID=A0A2S1SGY7_9FLAO|nr:biliverdin-producing heme oxygenase [Flavobacterium pallidum]AWI25629.1 hypothetical protein HYN49_06810 [Flavobacterium pallidum]